MAVLEMIENEFQERDFTIPVEQKTEIEIEHLCVEFPDQEGGAPVVALKDVNLEIHQGEFISLVGPSGCGKTTLLRAIADLQKITEGKIEVRGQTPRQIRLQKKYGIVFQSPVLYDWRTVRRNVCMPMELMGMPKKDRTARVSKMLDLVGLLEFGKHYPRELSGGMQQRVGIARALAIRPEILLMDEPFSALDAYLRERMLTELMEMLSDYEGTVIMVSHSRDEIYSFSEEVLVIEDGHGIRLGPVKEVFNAPRYKTAARLTGCKNIADVYRMDAQTVYVKDWDVQLIFKGRSVPENVKAIGIRAHDLIPVYGTISGAMLKVKEWKSVDYPFERKYFIQCESGCEDFCWFVQREISATLEEKGMPDALAFPEEKVLFLEG